MIIYPCVLFSPINVHYFSVNTVVVSVTVCLSVSVTVTRSVMVTEPLPPLGVVAVDGTEEGMVVGSSVMGITTSVSLVDEDLDGEAVTLVEVVVGVVVGVVGVVGVVSGAVADAVLSLGAEEGSSMKPEEVKMTVGTERLDRMGNEYRDVVGILVVGDRPGVVVVVVVSGSVVTVVVPTPLDTVTVSVEEIAVELDAGRVGVAMSGSMVMVMVPTPLDSVTVRVLVIVGELTLLADGNAPPVVGEVVGTMPSGIVPRIRRASAMSAHPTTTPPVTFKGIAKHEVPGALQGVISKAPPSPGQVARPPAMHAAWPGRQADCSVKVAKMLFNSRAARTLSSNTDGGTVVVGKGVSIIVGIMEFGVPVALRVGWGEDKAPEDDGVGVDAVDSDVGLEFKGTLGVLRVDSERTGELAAGEEKADSGVVGCVGLEESPMAGRTELDPSTVLDVGVARAEELPMVSRLDDGGVGVVGLLGVATVSALLVSARGTVAVLSRDWDGLAGLLVGCEVAGGVGSEQTESSAVELADSGLTELDDGVSGPVVAGDSEGDVEVANAGVVSAGEEARVNEGCEPT